MPQVKRSINLDPNKIYMLGEEGSGIEPRGTLQNYEELKTMHLQQGTLFEDPQFNPKDISLGVDATKILKEVEWLRPKDIVDEPHFIIGGKDRFDINQGILSDCWFLSAVADITQNPHILEHVVPNNQKFDESYAGIFHFRLYGSYGHIEGGFASEALGDLTGGLTEIHRAGQVSYNDDLFDHILVSYEKHSFLACAIMNCYKARNGLIDFHAYSITEVRKVPSDQGNDIKLLRIRNPWGRTEWTGNWSDSSEKWNTVSSDIKADLSVRIKNDGEFWMEFKDFMEHYDLLEMCHPNPDLGPIHWNCCMLDGTWGPNEDMSEYSLTLEGEDITSTHTVIIGLMQKNRRVNKKSDLAIGFKILTFERDLLNTKPTEKHSQVTENVRLKKGKYVIVPLVKKSLNISCEYLLRVYSTAEFDLQWVLDSKS